ncbi:MAG: hypothetical protein IKQ15_05155 [Kiritimatiellae bacterium]|nr:hypothetical protein [Kiritimatiellia bacterium]
MYLNLTPKLINQIANNWEDPRKAEETQELIEAIVAELKKDYRAFQRKHSRISDEDVAHWEDLIADVTNPEFWYKFDHLLNFGFEY